MERQIVARLLFSRDSVGLSQPMDLHRDLFDRRSGLVGSGPPDRTSPDGPPEPLKATAVASSSLRSRSLISPLAA